MVSWLKNEQWLPSDMPESEKLRINNTLGRIQISIQPDLKGQWATWFGEATWPSNTALVCDNSTWKALGETLTNELKAAGFYITLINLGSSPHADSVHLEYVMQHANACRAIIGVGSGTVNDLCKLASFRLRLPYAICGTAPSMNGYLSANAAIMQHGHKQSLPAHLPQLALFDLTVLKAAPQRLHHAGLGDAMCRSTAQFDCLLSHLLMKTAYDPLPFSLLAKHEPAMMRGDLHALILTLLLSGLGMTLAGGSFPASEGEHLLAHYIEMRYPHIAHQHLHGEHIAVTTLHMAKRQAKLLAGTALPAVHAPWDMAACLSHFGQETGHAVWQEWQQKQTKLETLRINASGWKDLQAALQAVHIPPERLQAALEEAGAPVSPKQIGWSNQMLEEAVRYAHLIRNRVTALDFVC